jgi:hypothetical protein
MQKGSNKYLTQVLKEHLAALRRLQYQNYCSAEILYNRTKILATTYFAKEDFTNEWLHAKFCSNHKTAKKERAAWNEVYGQLVAISQAMLERVEFRSQNQSTRYTMYTSLLIIFSSILWIFNNVIKWKWLSDHPQKFSIYVTIQVILLLVYSIGITENKKSKTIEIIGICLSSLFSVIAMFLR